MQSGILDILDDNGDLSTVENIFKTYQDYQTQITELKNSIDMQQQQTEINDLVNAHPERDSRDNVLLRAYVRRADRL